MKKSELIALINECVEEMTNLDMSSMNEKSVKEDVISNTDPIIMKTWDRHSAQFNKSNLSFTDCYEAYEQGFLDGYEHAEKKYGIQ